MSGWLWSKEKDEGYGLPSFQDFPMIPKKGHVTVCEVNTDVRTTHSNRNPDGYLAISPRTLQPLVSKKTSSFQVEDPQELFLPIERRGMVKSLWDGWYTKGVDGIIEEMRKAGVAPALVTTINVACKSTILLWSGMRDFNNNMTKLFYPHRRISPEDLIERFAPVRQWKKSWIRAMVWDKHYPVLAVAKRDDTVIVIHLKKGKRSILKHRNQRMVSSMCWRPYVHELAVGVEKGIVIWNTNQKLGSTRAKLLSVNGHGPVTSVDYSYTGQWLLSSSAADTSIIIWECSSSKRAPFRRVAGGGVPRALFSPTSVNRIFCNSPDKIFRLWVRDSALFEARKWNTHLERVEAFAWSSCGKIVIFVSDSILYSINWNPAQVEFVGSDEKPKSVRLFNLNACLVNQEDGDFLFKVGGQVLQLAWDSTGKRLAILFADSDVIALFRIETRSQEFIFPCGFIRGHDGEFPLTIAFRNRYPQGAMLTIAWSSERLQNFPMVFTERGVGRFTVPQQSRRLDRQQQRMSQTHTKNYFGSQSQSQTQTSFGERTPTFERPTRNTAYKLFSPY